MASTGRHNTRVSPRKFSEKIALLNKKEQEGNAEFEEIIKEVQATKSQTNLKRHFDESNFTPNNECDNSSSILNRDSLEEVYESLVRYVQQPDEDESNFGPGQSQAQEPHRQQRLQQHPTGQQIPRDDSNLAPIDHEIVYPATDNGSTIFNGRIDDIDSATNDNGCVRVTNSCGNSYTNINLNKDTTSMSATRYSPVDLQSNLSTSSSTMIRGRVTSVGSANCKYICHNVQYKHNECSGEFLSPSIDKSWSKSCSDPILNVPLNSSADRNMLPAQETGIHNLESQTVELKQPVCTIGVDTSSQQHASITDSSIYDQTATTDYNQAACCKQTFQNDKIELASNASISHSVAPQSTKIYHNSQAEPRLQQNTLEISNISGEVPGIQICSIDDIRSGPQITSDGRETPSGCGSQDSSLPDISNLQFEIPSPENSYNTGFSNNLGYERADTETEKIYDMHHQNTTNHWFNRPQVNTCSLQQQRYNRTIISNSDCGMLHQFDQQQQDPSLISTEQYNIIRSRSHNSIDHLAKQAQGRLINNQDLSGFTNTQVTQCNNRNVWQEEQFGGVREDYYNDNSCHMTYHTDYSAPYSN